MFRILAGEALVLAVLATVATDLGAHRRVETQGGLNIRGYRGPVAHQRQPNELRVVFVGGTRAFGWGEPASGTTVAAVRFELSRVLDRPHRPLQPIVAINLGQLGAPPESYPSTLAHFAYLRPDYIGIFDDLGDAGPNRPFDASGIFEWTGYQPMLPLVLYEKGAVMRAHTLGVAVQYVGRTLAAADRALARIAGVKDEAPPSASSSDAYAAAMMTAIAAAHQQAKGVAVVLGPVDSAQQRRNRRALSGRLAEKRGARWLRVVDLSEQAELYNPLLRLDAFSFGANASGIAGRAIAPAFLDLISPR